MHFKDKTISLKAKGLLSQMLSLSDDWDYTLEGLARINMEKIDTIRSAVRELERAGYIIRSRVRDEKGHLRGNEYIIYESPQTKLYMPLAQRQLHGLSAPPLPLLSATLAAHLAPLNFA